MEELAKEINEKMTRICIEYLFLKQTDVITKVLPLTEDIQSFLNVFLQGNVFGIEEEDYEQLLSYAFRVAEDYVEAISQKDAVLMIDTLDYGLRELLNIYLAPVEDKDGRNI